jgi:hypothetical protein
MDKMVETNSPDLRGELRLAIATADRAAREFQRADAACEIDAATFAPARGPVAPGDLVSTLEDDPGSRWSARDAAMAANDAVVHAANRILIAEADRLILEGEARRAVMQYIASLPIDSCGSANAASDRIAAFLARDAPREGEFENHPAVAAWRAALDRLAVAREVDARLPE